MDWPGWTEYVVPSVRLCVNSQYNICKICWQRILNCPTCRQPFLNIRNLTLEKLVSHIKYPCTYWKYGGKGLFAHVRIGKYQDKCWYSQETCPMAKLKFETCSWTSNYDDTKKQCRRNALIIVAFMSVQYWELSRNSLLLGHVTSLHSPTMRSSSAQFCQERRYFMLFCSILVLLKMLLNTNRRLNSLLKIVWKVLQ